MAKEMNNMCKLGTVLTERQYQVYRWIGDFIAECGKCPTFRDVAKKFSLSKTRIQQLICALKNKGMIEHEYGSKAALRVIDGLPVIKAGKNNAAQLLATRTA